ncbi:MAG TPA: iron ABC transporter permease [Thermoleophilaceae bacterium]|nr:iron ABC transporter permease [Thermoleophilaceae bacterium]
MGLTTAVRGGLAPARRPAVRLDGWTVSTVAVAMAVAGPLIVLPASFLAAPGALSDFAGLLPDALVATALLVAGVGAGTLVLGTGLAALVAFCDFPGRRWIEWALVLPLAMPGYVFTLFALGSADASGLSLSTIRSPLGAIAVFTLVLYPYVYLLARAAFLAQAGDLVEAARGLGLSRPRAILRVAIPLARPAIVGGVALALMEALADFGTVNLLGVQTFTNAIYKVWFGAFDRDAALQLATMLMTVTLALLMLERISRGRARYAQGGQSGRAQAPVRLRGLAAAAALIGPLLLLGLVVLAPVAQLGAWSLASVRDGLLAPEFALAARNSLMLAGMSIAIVVAVALLLAYGRRASGSRASAAALRVSTIGYGLPGSVVAVAVIVPLGWLDHRLDDAAGVGLLLTGTVIGLFAAYTVRFLALAFQSVDTGLERVPRSLDEAARGLGSDRLDVLARVHVPLIAPALLTAGLLVFTEVMKELPATLLLRPLGGDTLAIAVWQATTESLYETAALPALLIVLVGLIPVGVLIRLSRRAAS